MPRIIKLHCSLHMSAYKKIVIKSNMNLVSFSLLLIPAEKNVLVTVNQLFMDN